ncbi:MAG: hypothetical protein GY894_10420, partial [Planctomycetes bacterium]|nr:hypothetical protein [Planctomycetota bacterium]
MVEAVPNDLRMKGWIFPAGKANDGAKTSTWLGDSATLHHVVGNASRAPFCEVPTEPINLWTTVGLARVTAIVTATTEAFGDVQGYVKPNSPNWLPIGRRVTDDYETFVLTGACGLQLYRSGTHLELPRAECIQHEVDEYVPTVCTTDWEEDDTFDHGDELRPEDVVAEVKRQLARGLNSCAIAPTSTMAVIRDEHRKLRMLAWPEKCEACRSANLCMIKSIELKHDKCMKATATTYDEKIHLYWIGPTWPSERNENYLLCGRDNASGKPNVGDLKDKYAEEICECFGKAV